MSADNKLSTERRNLVDDYLDNLLDRKEQLTSKMAKFEAIINGIEFRLSHIPDQTRDDIVKACDKAEAVVPAELWTIGTYKELLFLDSNQGGEAPIYD